MGTRLPKLNGYDAARQIRSQPPIHGAVACLRAELLPAPKCPDLNERMIADHFDRCEFIVRHRGWREMAEIVANFALLIPLFLINRRQTLWHAVCDKPVCNTAG
jgi:hypothetical protein